MEKIPKKIVVFIVIVLVAHTAIFFLFGVAWGYTKRIQSDTIASVFNGTPYTAPDIDLAPFWEAWSLIDEKYVFPDKPDNQKRLWGAIRGLIQSVPDPYTTFLPPEEASVFEEDVNGNFGGVGVEISMRSSVLTVVSPLKGSPAEIAGLKPGDIIIEVDGESTINLNIDEATSRIRGKEGTEVVLTIFRGGKTASDQGETLDITIKRGNIQIPTINFYEKKGVFIIELYNFSGQSPVLFERALNDFKKTGLNKLIIDLRGNPGGFLESSIEIASLFLPEGKVILRENSGTDRKEVVHYSNGYGFFNSIPEIFVLVDGGSASASEILAAALQEHGIATVVGEKTFGKGSVQELVPLTRDTFVKITTAKWLTPNGRSIEEDGVHIDIHIEKDSEDDENETDQQLEKSIQLLLD